MIPRTKVNYRLMALAKAAWASERNASARLELKELLSEKMACPNVSLSASGRGALYILLMCLPQRRVLVPAYTCKAVVEAVSLAGKQIEFVESELGGFNMDAASLDGRLDPDAIVIATHQFGIPCDVFQILEHARRAGAFVIEDAAASLGTRINGQMTGTFGDAAFFSFDTTKLVNVPLKGGFFITQDADLLARCNAFQRAHTREMPILRKLGYLLMGSALVMLEPPWLYRLFHNLKFNWRDRFTDDSAVFVPRSGPFYTQRLSEWQAQIILPQIKKLEKLADTRRRMYAAYRDRLQVPHGFLLPPCDESSEWAPIRFPIRTDGDKLKFYRQAAHKGVDFAFSFTFLASPVVFDRAHQTAATVLDLPFYDRLTEAELDQIVKVIKEVDAAMTGEG